MIRLTIGPKPNACLCENNVPNASSITWRCARDEVLVHRRHLQITLNGRWEGVEGSSAAQDQLSLIPFPQTSPS